MSYMMKPMSYVAVIVMGYLLKRIGFLRDRERQTLSRIMINITLPCAIMQAFDGLDAGAGLFLIAGLGLLCAGLPILLVYAMTRGKETRLRVYRMLNIGGYNIGCFSVPLISVFFGTQPACR